jgi:hypothetical protein
MLYQRPDNRHEVDCEQKLTLIADEMQKHLVVIQGCCEMMHQYEPKPTLVETIQLQVAQLEALRQLLKQN